MKQNPPRPCTYLTWVVLYLLELSFQQDVSSGVHGEAVEAMSPVPELFRFTRGGALDRGLGSPSDPWLTATSSPVK